MAGVPKQISLNSTRYSIPSDATITVVEGGRQKTDVVVFGDDTTTGVSGVVASRIKGVKVSTKGVSWDGLKALLDLDEFPIIYESGSKSYEGTGFLLCSDGLENDTTKDISSEFELVATNGGFRASA